MLKFFRTLQDQKTQLSESTTKSIIIFSEIVSHVFIVNIFEKYLRIRTAWPKIPEAFKSTIIDLLNILNRRVNVWETGKISLKILLKFNLNIYFNWRNYNTGGRGYKNFLLHFHKTSLFSGSPKWLVIRPHFFRGSQVAVY